MSLKTDFSRPPIRPSGRTMEPDFVRQVVDCAIDNGENEIARVTEDLNNGAVDLAEWQRRMERMIAVRFAACGIIALGGASQLNAADRIAIGRDIAEQLRYLQGFARDIETGKQRVAAVRRAKPLGRAIRRTDDDIDVLSTLTPALEAEARDWWYADAPAGFGEMFDAEGP